MPMSLADLSLATSYHKGRDDIAGDFYLPCMARAVAYDRAVGFFRSTVFTVAWPALRDFVGRSGQMRVVCSHVLADADVEALEQGYAARADEALGRHFAAEVRELACDPVLDAPARLLAALVSNGSITLKVAVLRDKDRVRPVGRIFHDKLGVFSDVAGHRVVFKGSMNETWNGLAGDGNLESVDVFTTWGGTREVERVARERAYFDEVWNGTYPGLLVRDFPAVARAELERVASQDWEAELEAALAAQPTTGGSEEDPFGRTLRPHQSAGLASWRANGRRGILEFSTGSGKTFTAIHAVREALRDLGEVVLVVVPDKVLFGQWLRELEATTADLSANILRAGAGHTGWKRTLRAWTSEGQPARVVLATIQTASSPEFLSRISTAAPSLVVIDEVHRAGSPKHRNVLDQERFPGARLGLSATPRRAGDPEGTAALLDFFEGVLHPTYSLDDAIRDRVLCPYFYRPHVVALSDDEQDEWDELSGKIGQLVARQHADATADLNDRLKQLLIRRARVVKGASGKLELAVAVLREHYSDGDRWIVYCDSLPQLDEVRDALRTAGLKSLPFHSQMEADRDETLRWFERRGGIVVAIKCLDEGVDIPSVTHALILASSKNPREFIQRRGRVLRTADNKTLAFVHDALVVPRSFGSDGPDPITRGELARAIQFAEGADNPACGADLQQVAIDAGIEWEAAANDGLEVDDED